MTRRLIISIFAALLLLTANPGFARVTGLPDFTGLVEDTGPAVVNIQVTQFGERAQRRGDEMESPRTTGEEIPEFFRRFFDTSPGIPEWAGPDRQRQRDPDLSSSPMATSSRTIT